METSSAMKNNVLNNALSEEYLIYDRRSMDDADSQKNSLLYQRQRNLEYAKREVDCAECFNYFTDAL